MTFLQHAHRLARPKSRSSRDDAEQPRDAGPPAVALANSTNWRASRACDTGKFVISRSWASSSATPARAAPRRAGRAPCRPAGCRRRWRTGRRSDRTRRAARTRPADPRGRSRKRSSASSTASVDLAWNARSTPCGTPWALAVFAVLSWTRMIVAREALELEPLGLGAAADRRLRPTLPACCPPVRCCRVTERSLRCEVRRSFVAEPRFGGLDEAVDDALRRRAVVRQRPARDAWRRSPSGRPEAQRGARRRPRTPPGSRRDSRPLRRPGRRPRSRGSGTRPAPLSR